MLRYLKCLVLIVLIQVLTSCTNQDKQTQLETMKENQLTITGIAKNAIMGAVLVTEDNSVYYIDGLESWDDTTLNKKVSATGSLKTETFKEEDLQNEKGEWKEGMSGEKQTLLTPVWKIVDN